MRPPACLRLGRLPLGVTYESSWLPLGKGMRALGLPQDERDTRSHGTHQSRMRS